MDPTDLQGPDQKWSPLILSELYRLPLPSSLAGERGGPREGGNLLRTCGRGTLPLVFAACVSDITVSPQWVLLGPDENSQPSQSLVSPCRLP